MRPGLILLILLCLLAAPVHAVENPLALLAGENTRLEVVMSDGPEGLADNVRAHVGSLQDKDADALARYRRRAEHLAQQALQALGYYEAQVRSELVGEGGDARLRLHIEPGTPLRLRNVDIRVTGEAAQMPGFISPDGPQLQPGAVLSHGAYDDARKLIGNQALRYGFFAGRFLQRDLLIDPPEQAADIHLHWDSGPRYRFGAVEFSGNPPVSADLLQRLQPIRAGEPYHSDRLGELSRALQASGYFQDIQLDASPEQAEGSQLPVRVKLTARDPRSLAAGAGYSTDVGARLRGNFTRHWLGEDGHSWGSEFELSTPRQNLTAWYQIPLDPPLTDSLRFTSGYQHEDLVDTRSTRWTLGTQWQHQTASDWQRVLSLRLEQESYTLADEDGNSSLLLPGIAFSRTRSDSKVDPHEGWSLQLELSGASRGLISDANLLWGRARGKYLTTFAGGHRLLARAELGSIATDDFSAIPPSLRFFTGGDQSVRGFDYQTLSPLDSTGERVGGRNLVVGSLEYQYPLREKWRLATFVDQGNAIDSPRDPLRTGVGFGVRWVSPVGPLRLDIARGLSDSYGEGGWRIHFSMGPEL